MARTEKVYNLVMTALILGLIMMATATFKIPSPFTQGYVHLGDTIIFQNSVDSTKQLYALVKNLYAFKNFEALYASLPLDQCGYMPEEISNASPKDMERYYPLDMQAKYGVIGIEIQLL